MDHKSKSIIKNPVLSSGQVGESAIWDGPLNTDMFPKGKGSSRILKKKQKWDNLEINLTS